MASNEIDFRAVYVSGSDESDEADFSDQLVGFLRGDEWISRKYCHFPQELVLKLKSRARLEKIQILCHATLIPRKIELHAGDNPSRDKPSLSNAKFESLGSVSLRENQGKGGRELKSVYVDTTCWFVKLLVKENYENRKRNAYNQVGIVHVTLFGSYLPPEKGEQKPVEDEILAGNPAKRPPPKGTNRPTSKAKTRTPSAKRTSSSFKGRTRPTGSARRTSSADSRNRPTSGTSSILGESQEKGYASELRQLATEMERKKKAAIKDENFSKAKLAKQAIRNLQEAASTMDQLERSKREAIEDEDFDKAMDLKEEMVALREQTYSEVDPINQALGKSVVTRTGSGASQTSKRRDSTPKSTQDDEASAGGSRKLSNAFLDKENRVVPAHERRHSLNPQTLGHEEQTEVDESIDDGEREDRPESAKFIQALDPAERSDAAQAVDEFGSDTVSNFYSKKWENRKQGLLDIKQKMESSSKSSKREAGDLLQTAMRIVIKALKDKVFQVYATAVDVLKYLLLTYVPQHEIHKTHGSSLAKNTAPVLITRTGDTATDSRFKSTTVDALKEIIATAEPPIPKIYAGRIMRPFEASGYVKIDEGQAEIAQIIVQMYAPNKELNLREEPVCEFAVSCLMHTDAEVRKIGVNLILHMYREGDKETIRAILPPHKSPAVQKNPLFRSLYQQLDNIDGNKKTSVKTTAKPPRGYFEDDVESQDSKEELEDLRRKNKQLKEMLTRGLSEQSLTKESQPTRSRPQQRGRNNGARGRHKQPPTAPPISDRDIDKMCMFCGEINQKFDADGLDKHYLLTCAMLTKCQHCNEMIEVAQFRSHLLNECVAKDDYMICDRCDEPIQTRVYKRHTEARKCPTRHDNAEQ